ncbi:hypothetical protein VHEMI08565 [[Torrubiella] hemipterigena]|uniref:Uncharacterized protein n=1 Tax=[Torrubiella] hemipterigena TaxID=1531966 RepID=A0A0A1TDV2_9HYPO|nr:hypothetical protein VHEMI08565 [[Torrubiella] hemipterigena]
MPNSRSQATVLDCLVRTSALANFKLLLFCVGILFLCSVIIRPLQTGPSRFSNTVWVATAFITSVITLSIADTSRNGTRLDHSLLVMGCFTIIATLLLWTHAVTEKADKEETPQREKRPSTRQYVA